MAEAKPPPKREDKAPPREYYEKVGKESNACIHACKIIEKRRKL